MSFFRSFVFLPVDCCGYDAEIELIMFAESKEQALELMFDKIKEYRAQLKYRCTCSESELPCYAKIYFNNDDEIRKCLMENIVEFSKYFCSAKVYGCCSGSVSGNVIIEQIK